MMMESKEKTALNVGLFRFCAIVFFVNWVSTFAFELLHYLAPAENMLSSDEPLWATVLLLIPIAFVVLAFVKKSALLLKIISALCIVVYICGGVMRFYNLFTITSPYYHSIHLSITCLIVREVLKIILNTGLVVYVAAFFTRSAWQVDETRKTLNLPLFRTISIIFVVWGLGGIAETILKHLEIVANSANAFSWQGIFFSLLSLTAGIYALVKRNSFVLKVYALFLLANHFGGCISAMLESFSGAMPVGHILVNTFLSSALVFYVAAFFIEPEKNRIYLQKLKSLLLKWKRLT